jgi:hypothetical protein
MIGDRWGVSDAEISRPYPCDEFMRAPALEAWRGVDVAAPPEAVWPWVAQVRIAPYSYDWIDNRGRRSPRELADLAEPRVGEAFTTTGGRAVGRIVSVEAGKQLTGTIMGAYMSYVLLPADHDGTRLLLKVVMRTSGLTALGLCVGDLIMSRRQLLNLKRLAERHRRGDITRLGPLRSIRLGSQAPCSLASPPSRCGRTGSRCASVMAGAGRRSCCCTATRRRTSCGTWSRQCSLGISP